ncbi:MAG: hypothetical protein OXF01_10770, partial [Gemmatimonadetes bacterium]|nr:hypothetical protein [Gemmatimonadota bacterium]
GVWFGMDLPVSIVDKATGGGLAAPVWGDFMRRVYYGDPETDDGAVAGNPEPNPLLTIPEPWSIPPGLIRRRVDRKTGLLASRWCPAEEAYEELYLPGTEPTVPCDLQARPIARTPQP